MVCHIYGKHICIYTLMKIFTHIHIDQNPNRKTNTTITNIIFVALQCSGNQQQNPQYNKCHNVKTKT